MDLSNLMQLTPISCCFLPRQPFVPTSCSGCVWVREQERGWRVPPRGFLYLEDTPPPQTSTFSICRLVLGALLPSEGSCAWETRMLRRAIGSFPWLLSHATAKTGPSLLVTWWKKQLSKLCAPPVGRQQRVWAAGPNSTSLHGVYVPSQSLLTTCLGMYRCCRHL